MSRAWYMGWDRVNNQHLYDMQEDMNILVVGGMRRRHIEAASRQHREAQTHKLATDLGIRMLADQLPQGLRNHAVGRMVIDLELAGFHGSDLPNICLDYLEKHAAASKSAPATSKARINAASDVLLAKDPQTRRQLLAMSAKSKG